ncbi:MAG: hypothetical protein J5608_01900 [Alphaproteobacteria bacterium]|nr:hypothetical protein [Alphaproteobacteria bacterium]
MKIFGKKFDDKKINKTLWYVVIIGFAFWFVYRFIMVAVESRMTVFNPVRDMQKNGIVVSSVVAHRRDGVIKMPIVIKDNKAYVSGPRKAKLNPGQKMDGGEIVFVSKNLDFDSGMYVVRTRSVADGINYVQIPESGFFVPTYAVRDGKVMIAENSIATERQIESCGQDADIVCISSGLVDGDIVILTKVDNGQKIKIQK